VGLKIVNAYCTDSNFLNDGNSGGTFGTVTNGSFTIPAANTVAGSVLVCHTVIGFASPTIVVKKLMGGSRISDTDQFTVQVKAGTTLVASGIDSAGLGSSVNAGTGTTAVFTATPGTSYSVNEAMTAGSDSKLGQYSASVGCSNAYQPAGAGTDVSGVKTTSDTFSPKAGDVITCTITNTPKVPVLTVTKALGTDGRVNSNDQFMLQIVRQSDGAVVNSSANSTSGGSGAGVNTGTGTTGATTLVAGTSYSIKEAASGTTLLSQYSASVGTCSNSLSGGSVIPTTPGTPFTLKAGDAITCSLSNTGIKPSFQLRQSGPGGSRLAYPFSLSYSGTNGSSVSNVTATTPGVEGAYTPVQNLGVWNTDTVLAPIAVPAGLKISNGYCLDTNYAATGNTGGYIGSFTDTQFTIPAAQIKAASALTCTVVYGYAASTLNVTKTLGINNRVNSGDQFTVQILTGGSAINSTANSTTLGAGSAVTSGSGTTGVTTLISGTSYSVNEVASGGTNLAQYSSSVSCTNTGVGSTAVPGTPGTPFTAQSGDVIDCQLTNTPKAPTIQVKKALGPGGRANAGDQFTVQINNLAGTSTLASSNTGGSAGTLTGGDTGAFAVTPGTGYTINEAPLNGTKLVQYTSAVRCLNNGVSVGTVSKLGDSVTPAVGDAYVCTITNTPAPARLYIKQALTVSITHTLPISADYTGTNGWTLQTLTNTVMGTVGSVSTPQETLTAFNTVTQITASPPLHWSTLRFSCIDQSGVSPGTFGTLLGNTLTIPAANVLPGAVLLCTSRLDASAPY
jgi:hypothetical protein